MTDSFGPQLEAMDCLGFLAGSACPHYDGEELRRPRYAELLREGFPAGIAIDNKAHPTCSLVQIEAPDRVGLLYDLLTALESEGVSIFLSRISTQKGAAIDTFYIADSTTRTKITDSSRIAALQRRLRSVILGGHALIPE